jgi:hypothetical protein
MRRLLPFEMTLLSIFRNVSLRECIEGETAKAIIAIEKNSSAQTLGVFQRRSFRPSYDGRYNMHLCGAV